MKSSVIFLTLFLIAFAYADDTSPPKHDEYDYNCKPMLGYAVCYPYVLEYYYGGPPPYWSPCCELIREETPDCICHAFTYDHEELKVDMKKALDLPKSCGKEWAKYPCASR